MQPYRVTDSSNGILTAKVPQTRHDWHLKHLARHLHVDGQRWPVWAVLCYQVGRRKGTMEYAEKCPEIPSEDECGKVASPRKRHPY